MEIESAGSGASGIMKRLASVKGGALGGLRAITRGFQGAGIGGLSIDVTWVDLTIALRRRKKKTFKLMNIKHPVLLPSRVIGALWRSSPATFQKMFEAYQGRYVKFWEQLAAQPWCQEHPVIKRPSSWQWAIPYRIHGDAFRAYKSRKVMALSWAAGKRLWPRWTGT